MAAIPVLLVQAKPSLAKALRRVLAKEGYDVVASFEDHAEACSVSGAIAEPELILLLEPAAAAPQTDVIEYLRLSYPEAALVVLGQAAEKVALSKYVQAGASGRLSLAMTRPAMLRALRVILYGGRLFVAGDGRKMLPEARWDRRRSLRRDTFMRCEVDPGKGRPHATGRIYEMSHAGAKIRLATNVRLPAAFDLRIKGHLTKRCQIIRRSEGCFCVEFADRLGGVGPADRPMTHMGF